MSATNINRVVLTGNLTRDPELRSTAVRHRGLQPADRVQHAPQDQRRVGRQAQLLQRHRLGRPGRELRPLPVQGPAGRDRRPPGLARMEAQDDSKREAVEIVADSVQFLTAPDRTTTATAAARRPRRAGAGDGGRRPRRHPLLDPGGGGPGHTARPAHTGPRRTQGTTCARVAHPHPHGDRRDRRRRPRRARLRRLARPRARRRGRPTRIHRRADRRPARPDRPTLVQQLVDGAAAGDERSRLELRR